MELDLLSYALGFCMAGMIRIMFGTLDIWRNSEGFGWRYRRFDER